MPAMKPAASGSDPAGRLKFFQGASVEK